LDSKLDISRFFKDFNAIALFRLVDTLKLLATTSTVSPFFTTQSIPNRILLLVIFTMGSDDLSLKEILAK